MTDQSADRDFIIHGSVPSLGAWHRVFSTFLLPLLNIECSVPGASGSFEVQLNCAHFSETLPREHCQRSSVQRGTLTQYILLACVQWTLPQSLGDAASRLAVLIPLLPLYRLLVFF